MKSRLKKILVKWLSLGIFLWCAFSCTQKNPPKQDSQTDNLKSNVLDSAERFMSGFFLDEKMRITRLASANFQEAFVFETPATANSKNSDQVWRSLWMKDKSLGANTKCSGWFDAFLSGDQETFTPSDEKGEKYILQYRICTGPHNPNATTTGPIGWVRSLASYCASKATFQNTKPYDWTVYRTVNVKYHASMNLRREQSLCTAWKPKLFYLNLLGKAVNYSHTRVCSRVCDPMESDCKTNTVNFAEYAEYPTAEYLDSMRAQSGNKGCN